MEVLRHPDVGKKKFKEYFLEFLMIFLAVTLGLFTENTREYINDREKEHGDIISLARNLDTDSNMIESSLQSVDDTNIEIDTVMQLIRS